MQDIQWQANDGCGGQLAQPRGQWWLILEHGQPHAGPDGAGHADGLAPQDGGGLAGLLDDPQTIIERKTVARIHKGIIFAETWHVFSQLGRRDGIGRLGGCPRSQQGTCHDRRRSRLDAGQCFHEPISSKIPQDKTLWAGNTARPPCHLALPKLITPKHTKANHGFSISPIMVTRN